MNILIIEDDGFKYTRLEEFAQNLLPKANFVWKKSYQSGLQEILSNPYDLVLLDMSMHIYEPTAQETGGSFETYAGRMILSEIDMNEISTKVIVVTGYDVYSDGKTLATLKGELRNEFGDFYLDTVYFISKEGKWETELTQLIKQYYPDLFMLLKINTYLSILLVEDSEYKAEKVKNFIQEIATNARITVAKDQVQALRHLETEKFDLMLLDMQLPIRFGEGEAEKTGGETILSEIEMNESIKQPTKIIAFTEFDELQSNIRESFPELGAIKFDATSKKWEDSLLRSITSLAKSKQEQKIIVYCEEQNDRLYNLIGFESIEFRGLKGGSKEVYKEAKFNKSTFALRDRDYLSKNEITKLNQKYPNFLILGYYCFENYLYHPDNIVEYAIKVDLVFDKDDYKNEIINQKNKKLIQIAQDYKSVRKSYLDVSENNTSDEISKNHIQVFDALQSGDFETFYQYFDMKGTDKNKGFDRSFMAKDNLNKDKLVQTNWFKKQMEKVLAKILNYEK